MGQQQLLLLVLGIVIVGLAVVVGIQAFGENQKKANSDALVNDVVRIASDAQAWNLKPTAFGGGNGAFTGLDFADLGYAATSGVYSNLNGRFDLAVNSATQITIRGCDSQTGFNNLITAVVNGTGPANIATTVASTACPF